MLLILLQCAVLIQQLQGYTLEQLKNLWNEITDQTAIRIGCVKTLDAQLNSIEQDRIKQVITMHTSLNMSLGPYQRREAFIWGNYLIPPAYIQDQFYLKEALFKELQYNVGLNIIRLSLMNISHNKDPTLCVPISCVLLLS